MVKEPQTNSCWFDRGEDSPFPPPDQIREENLGQLFLKQALELRAKCFSLWRDPVDGQWTTISWQEAGDVVARCALHLSQQLRLQPGQRALMMTNSSLSALLAELSLLTAGLVTIPLPQSFYPKQLAALPDMPQVSILVLENTEQYESFKKLADPRLWKNLTCVITLNNAKNSSRDITFLSFDEFHLQVPTLNTTQRIERALTEIPQPKGSDLACIQCGGDSTLCTTDYMFLQSHDNYFSAVNAVALADLLGNGDNVFLGCPIHSSFGRICAFTAIGLGGSVIFGTAKEDETDLSKRVAQLQKDLKEAQPQTVLIERELLKLLLDRVATTPNRLRDWASEHYQKLTASTALSLINRFQLAIAKLGLRKVRSWYFGERLNTFLLQHPLELSTEGRELALALRLELLTGIWHPIATGALCSNTSHCASPGSAGRPFEGVEVKIEQSNNELLIQGPSVAKRASNPQENLTSFVPTGLFGSIDNEGFFAPTSHK